MRPNYLLFATSAFGLTRRGEANPSIGGLVLRLNRRRAVFADIVVKLKR